MLGATRGRAVHAARWRWSEPAGSDPGSPWWPTGRPHGQRAFGRGVPREARVSSTSAERTCPLWWGRGTAGSKSIRGTPRRTHGEETLRVVRAARRSEAPWRETKDTLLRGNAAWSVPRRDGGTRSLETKSWVADVGRTETGVTAPSAPTRRGMLSPEQAERPG